jgi:hypothetical protein
LSQLSNYRIADWLQVFGFRLDDISRVQAVLPRPRTALLDATVYDAHATIPWFQDRLAHIAIPTVAPLSQLLESLGPRQIKSLSAETARFLYAKVGQQDAFAFPDLVPGSIVRANPRLIARYLRTTRPRDSTRIFLVNHRGGACCCRLHFGTRNRVTLLPTQLPFAKVELQLDSQARIEGVLDLEFRPFTLPKISAIPACTMPEVAPELSRIWSPGPIEGNILGSRRIHLREARLRAGLSLHMASEMSREVANVLGDSRYFTSQSSLSDYEASDAPPRHVHKLFTLCVLYALPFGDLVKSFGIDPMSGAAPIPAVWMQRDLSIDAGHINADFPKPLARGFLTNIFARLEELPLFLRDSVVSLSGLPELSLHNIFSIGGQTQALHPALIGALFVVVNRRKIRPPAFRRKSIWEQPLYLVMKRDGSYLLANCTLEDNTLVVHPHVSRFVPEEQLRLRVDAEVVGQIVAVVRSVLSPP